MFTANRAAPWAEAVVVDGARIAGVGRASDLAARFPNATAIDVGGRTVLPGLIDAQNHVLATGESLASVDVRYPAVASVDALVDALTAAAAQTEPGRWVVAFGYDDARFDRVLTRGDEGNLADDDRSA